MFVGSRVRNFGLLEALMQNRKVPYGCLLAGPPCALFIFVSSSFHRRSNINIFGNQVEKLVRAANQVVSNLSVLLAICHARMVYWMSLGLPS